MSSIWITPEEIQRKKKRNRILGYSSIIIGMAAFTVLLTVFLNGI
ncbi:hypothetical protein [Sutcliffiella horikoshii]|nr:hypothetical protein [Sutcliffiella horikoshii]